MKTIVNLKSSIFVLLLTEAILSNAYAQEFQEGIIETRILDSDPQAGVKSQHFYYFDFNAKSVTDSFSTGTTKINLGVVEFEVSSIRDNFTVSEVKFEDNRVRFTMSGTTASGTGVTPDIDYRFSFSVTIDGEVSVGGCHDAYPAYLIQHNGADIYKFEHKSLDLLTLFGTCDISVLVN